MANSLSRDKAITLRKSGKSLNEITKSLAVPKSTVRYWCRDIVLSQKDLKRLAERHKLGGLLTAENRRKERLLKIETLKEEGMKEIGNLSKRDLFLAGVALYWAEGYRKGDGEFGFTNSDPRMIKLILKWLTETCGVLQSSSWRQTKRFLPEMRRSLWTAIFTLLVLPSFLFAQTNTPALQKLIAELQAKIQNLQEQVQTLKTELEKSRKDVEAVRAELKFTRTLSRGVSGDEVRELQKFLKQFPDIYPEGLITGYFGPLTEKAVKKLQARQGLETIGVVGPQTQARINELLASGAGASGNIPPGLLHAPGIQKKLATSTPVASKLSTPTTTPSGTIPATPAVPSGEGVSATSAIPATPGVLTPPPPPSGTPPPPPTTLPPPPPATATTTPPAALPPPPPPPPAASTLPAPTGLKPGFTLGYNVYNWAKINDSFSFNYDSTSLSQVSAFRLYQRQPGEGAFSVAAEFTNPSSLTSCSSSKSISGTWYLAPIWGSSCPNSAWSIGRTMDLQAVSNYAVGDYFYYLTVLDAAGKESSPSLTGKRTLLESFGIQSPTAGGSPTSPTPTFQWPVVSGWPRTPSYWIYLAPSDSTGGPTWQAVLSVSGSTGSKTYDGPALDPAKQYKVYIYGQSHNSDQSEGQSSFAASTETFWVASPPPPPPASPAASSSVAAGQGVDSSLAAVFHSLSRIVELLAQLQGLLLR